MFTERVICDFKVELYNMMKWLSEGSYSIRKIPIFVRTHTIYNVFTVIGRAILKMNVLK